jgi:hypothetical protein
MQEKREENDEMFTAFYLQTVAPYSLHVNGLVLDLKVTSRLVCFPVS